MRGVIYAERHLDLEFAGFFRADMCFYDIFLRQGGLGFSTGYLESFFFLRTNFYNFIYRCIERLCHYTEYSSISAFGFVLMSVTWVTVKVRVKQRGIA
jgi:hypothetical protein